MSCSENTDSTDCVWDFPINQEREITRLRAALAEAERDAARYRWIRYWNRVDPLRLPEDVSFEHEDDFDAAIDAAMERKEG